MIAQRKQWSGEQTLPGKNGEIQLTDALKVLNSHRKMYAHLFSGRRYDIGNKLDWLKANIDLGIKDKELGTEITAFIQELCTK